MTKLPMTTKPPGFATKISLWQRFKWWLGIDVYKVDFNIKEYTQEYQLFVNSIYNETIENTKRIIMPPINRKDK